MLCPGVELARCLRQLAQAMLLGQFIFVIEHAITTVDIAACKWLWSLLYKICLYLWFVSHRHIKPGFRKHIERIINPGRARNSVARTEVFDRGGTKDGPTKLFFRWFFRQCDGCLHQFRTTIFSIVEPVIHEIA